jgi:MvaI/BcnI restriction endonuclease family
MRKLSNIEQDKLKLLTSYSISLTLLEPTTTGLQKSIMDATNSVRNYLYNQGVHDYSAQQQGPESKVMIDTELYGDFGRVSTYTSVYRPNTKKGDPRIWVSGLKKICDPNDIIALIWFNTKLHVFNLSKTKLESSITGFQTALSELLLAISKSANHNSQELLQMLTSIALSGPIPSLVNADTSVGRTLETALGIDINSSKKPDYKGIELKAFRNSRSNRKTLFAQVPDWELSKLKSSAEILDAFGYWRGEDFKLYCTVSSTTINSQGLSLRLDSDVQQLIEFSDNKKFGDIVIWTLDKLHQRLLNKHKETFWVEAESIMIEGKEHFQYKVVEHTKGPIISQFDILLEQGIITLDHLIKRNVKGRVVEKGPLFKIKPNSLDLLFPPSNIYNLVD